MSLVSYSLHTPVVLMSDQCDNGAGSTWLPDARLGAGMAE